MKLIKVFSDRNFKNVRFNEHFNIVLAKIKDEANKKDTHNLGKTSLIHIIDFLLLGKFDNKKGLLSNKVFSGQTFYLELKLNNGQYLIIKRSINTPTRISFKINDIELAGFVPPTKWSETDIAFDKAKEKLNEYLEFDILTEYPYRKSITYFLRTQQDYLDVYQLNKFRGKHIDWKPFVFALLGFNGNLIEKKLQLEQDANNLKTQITTLQQEANVNIDEKDKILGLIDIKENEKTEAEQTIDKFNFFLKDNYITKEIIEDLDFKIQTLNTEKYRVSYELSKVEESLRNIDSQIDVNKLKELFTDVGLFFPSELKKQYEDLEKFNIAISKERRKYLKQNLQELRKELEITNIELQNLETEKSEKLSFLTEKDTYSKFKGYQKQLSVLEADVTRLKEKLELIDKSVGVESQIRDINEKITQSINDIAEAIKERKHAEINRIFDDILKEIVNTDAIISIKQNTQGNVEFSADYIDSNDKKSTSEAEGTSYKKLLCMAFDLALLIHYSKKSFFRFVYHDGIIEGLDNRIKLRLLDKIKSICTQYNIQHIITLIDSDIPKNNDGSDYSFSNEEICLRLDDLNDEGKLFKQSF
ncbi:MAG: DUF2326 domain-containing protein [Prevotellaceae bacterium]|jgi:uncharacterized protein YydD (DUF2326 family)|nr:DUF2326 domain-containing protein [Prevotellaceae bacterium]